MHSTSGGVGASLSSLLLSGAIRETRLREDGTPYRVVVVDADFRNGSLSGYLHTYIPTLMNVVAEFEGTVVGGEASSELVNVDPGILAKNVVTEESLGVDVFLSPVNPHGANPASTPFFLSVLGTLRGMYDVVVVDCPSGVAGVFVETLFGAADKVLEVGSTNAVSCSRAMRTVICLRASREDGGCGLTDDKVRVLFRLSEKTASGREKKLLARVESTVRVAGIVPSRPRKVSRVVDSWDGKLSDLFDIPKFGGAYRRLAETLV